MAKGKATVTGTKKQNESDNTVTKAGTKQVSLRSMMERGRQNLRVAKTRAKEQIMGKSGVILGKVSGGAPTTRAGLALVRRARMERMNQFKEAKKKLEEKRRKDLEQGDEVMDWEEQNSDVKIKQEMLDEPTTFSAVQNRGNMEIEKNDEETDVPNEINMDGDEFTEDGRPETAEEYTTRIEKEEHEINLQKADISDEDWEQIEVEVEKEKQAKELEEMKKAKEGVTDTQSKGESSEERSEQTGEDGENQSTSDNSNGKDTKEEDNQSVESNTGNQMDHKQEVEEVDEVIIEEESTSDEGNENENEQGNTNEGAEETENETEVPTPKVTKISFADITKRKGKTQQYLGAVVNWNRI